MKKANDIFLNMYPIIDLHGMDRDTAIVTVKDFISDNIKLNNKKIIIIHGKGSGILKESVHIYLNKDNRVLEYKIDNFNSGLTVASLKLDK